MVSDSMTTVAAKSPNHPAAQKRTPSVRDCLRQLATSIQFLKGVGPKRAEQLEAAGLSTVEDVLYHLPFRSENPRAK